VTRLSSVGVLEQSFMTIVQYWRPLQIHLGIFDTFATVAPDVEPTHGTSVRDTFATLAPNVGPTSNIFVLDKFAILLPFEFRSGATDERRLLLTFAEKKLKSRNFRL